MPWIGASQFPPIVRIGPTYVPGRTGCLDCQHSAWAAAHPLLMAIEREAVPLLASCPTCAQP